MDPRAKFSANRCGPLSTYAQCTHRTNQVTDWSLLPNMRVFPEEWWCLGKPGVPPYATRFSFHVFNSEIDMCNMVVAIADILRK